MSSGKSKNSNSILLPALPALQNLETSKQEAVFRMLGVDKDVRREVAQLYKRLGLSKKQGVYASIQLRRAPNDAVARRILHLRDATKLDTQELRSKTIKQLEQLFDVAVSIAKGKTKFTRVDGKEIRISLKLRQMWARVAANIAATIGHLAKGFDERQLDEDLAKLESMMNEIKAESKTESNRGTASKEESAKPSNG